MIVIIAVELCPLLHLLHTISGCGLAKHRMKLKTMKFSSKGLGRNSVKFCTTKISHYTVMGRETGDGERKRVRGRKEMRKKNEMHRGWREEFRDKERGWNGGNLILKRA